MSLRELILALEKLAEEHGYDAKVLYDDDGRPMEPHPHAVIRAGKLVWIML